MKYVIGVLSCLLLSFCNYAQDAPVVKEVATGLRADGKIYVVMAVALMALLGLVIYLINLDRKISRLEKHRS